MTLSGFGGSAPAKLETAMAVPKAAAGLDALPRKSDSVEEARGWVFFGALLACAVAASGNLVSAVVEQRPDAWIAVAIVVAIFLSSLVASIAGFAFSVLAGSALAYLRMDPVRAVQAMVLCSFATQLFAVWQLRASIQWRSLWPMVVAGAATIPVGVWLLVHAAGPAYALGLGGFLLVYGGYLLLRRKPRAVPGTKWHDALAGALGGITGGVAGSPALFVTIWCSMRGWDKLRQRAVYQPYILAMQVVTIGCLQRMAPANVHAMEDAHLVPFALLGAMGGLALFRRMTNNQFQRVVSTLLLFSGLGLLVRASLKAY